jgi:hypothetical protein
VATQLVASRVVLRSRELVLAHYTSAIGPVHLVQSSALKQACFPSDKHNIKFWE